MSSQILARTKPGMLSICMIIPPLLQPWTSDPTNAERCEAKPVENLPESLKRTRGDPERSRFLGARIATNCAADLSLSCRQESPADMNGVRMLRVTMEKVIEVSCVARRHERGNARMRPDLARGPSCNLEEGKPHRPRGHAQLHPSVEFP